MVAANGSKVGHESLDEEARASSLFRSERAAAVDDMQFAFLGNNPRSRGIPGRTRNEQGHGVAAVVTAFESLLPVTSSDTETAPSKPVVSDLFEQ